MPQDTTAPAVPTFARVSAVERTEPDHVGAADAAAVGFTAELHPDWTIGGKPNGGYLLAILGRAATTVGTHAHVLAASAHYLHSPEPGPVQVTVEVLRAGRTASQLRARMAQDGRPCVEALLTATDLVPTEPYWDAATPDPGTTPYADAVRIPGTSPTGVRVAIMDQVEVRLDAETLDFAAGRPRGHGELRGWLSLPDGEAFDPVSLLYAVDAFPPATFDIAPSGWVPTLELTAYVRALPAPGPLRVLHRAHLVDGQRVDEACWLWDSRGRVVAHGVQLAGIRLG
ncbi:Thioesterase-like superfamily protein [Jatrophihabitans endophyticus]|uniref:Thioesterase-like superfamily protein n=1 Tax=Jatrophihabitans endophyticus TaxID=1206085 RepID=A0A1M5D6K1_9ACTN|nr:thioesterase family protein [Jatrophihabitans endophyticus]SHF62618.1 Thioesterase-like superfamily protein [Jatrophihabitans endophyticus]